MTDLDLKIAELKGWDIAQDDYLGEVVRFDTPMGRVTLEPQNWSTSDAKAFELVDEVTTFAHPYPAFELFVLATEPKHARWMAKFHSGAHTDGGVGETRAEAICRAYIALKEWEGKSVAKG